MLLAKRKKKRIIVFLCTGNTCRSPMAQGLLQDYLDRNGIKHIEVRTAGVMTIDGLLPTAEAVQVMESASVEIDKHRSARLTPELLKKADLVLGMTPFHVQDAKRKAVEWGVDGVNDKTFLLKEYTKSDMKNYQINDPMGATLEVYKRVYREIKLAIDKLTEMDVIHAPMTEELKHERWEGEKLEKAQPEEPKKPAKRGRRSSKPANKKPASA
ncbi:MAG: hypothetical protein RLY93_11525 [Sumerlaeia bacterium]